MVKYKMVIYDCDGVIFDSFNANYEFYNYIFKKFDIPKLDKNDKLSNEIMHTYSVNDVFKYFVKEKQILPDILSYAKSIDYSIFYKFMVMEDNFFQACYSIKDMGLKIAVATNRSTSFKGIAEYFNINRFLDDYTTAIDVENPKPAPDMLNLILLRNNLRKDEVLFIGDSNVDYEASLNAKVDFVGYKFYHKNILSLNNHLEILSLLS